MSCVGSGLSTELIAPAQGVITTVYENQNLIINFEKEPARRLNPSRYFWQ
jgi:hypothetical protein